MATKLKQYLVIAVGSGDRAHARYLTAAKDEQEARDRVQAQEFALWMASRTPSDDRPITGREDQDQPFEIVSVEEA
jgi:hypothetical protein